jgi:hypothetical protein
MAGVEASEDVHRRFAIHQVGAAPAMDVQVDEARQDDGFAAGAADRAAVHCLYPFPELHPPLYPSIRGEDAPDTMPAALGLAIGAA